MSSLLILSLLHLVALKCPVSGYPLRSREEPIPSDPDIDTRTLFSIVSGCLATVFACTWVSVHPNVPGPNQSKLVLACRRLGLMLVGVIAPELIAGFAARQFLDARWFSKKYDVSIMHGFFFAMGGFVSADGHHPIVDQEQLELRPEYLAAIQRIRVEDIEDKSKGDWLSKGVVLIQGLWFTTQCLARVQQHLPLTELEVATLAFQFVNIFIWLLWWHKPLDVQQPILLGFAHKSARAKRRKQRHNPAPKPKPVQRSSVAAVINAVKIITLGNCPNFDPGTSTSVPSFWSTHGFGAGGPTKGFVSKFIFVQFLIGTVFGLIHCAAWNAHFPSLAELLIWRSCSLVIATTPFAVTLVFIWALKPGPLMSVMYPTGGKLMLAAGRIIAVIGSAAYIAARLILIALSFATLRALPDRAFVDVNWSTYIPHF